MINAALGGVTDDPEHAVRAFEAHVAAVRASIEPARLLVYDVREGWEPLCAFLERDVPSIDFPRVNSRDEFDAIFFS